MHDQETIPEITAQTTLKLTVPVLDALVKRDPDFLVQLSFAAAKEIGARYGDGILQSTVVQDAIKKADAAIGRAKVEAGEHVARSIGEWNSTAWGSQYRLRADVAAHLQQNFQQIIEERFRKWLETVNMDQLIEQCVVKLVNERFEAVLKQRLGVFLTGR